MKLGVDFHHINKQKITTIGSAAKGNNFDAVKMFAEMGVILCERGIACPLHLAAGYGNPQMLELLVSLGIPINWKDGSGWTALHYASRVGSVECIKWLVENGASITVRDVKKGSPLHFAGSPEVVKELLSLGMPLEEKAYKGKTPLITAVINTQLGVIEALVKAGAFTGKSEETQNSPIIMALKRGNQKSLEKLISLGIPLHPSDSPHPHPLKVITENDHPHLVQPLVKLGVVVR